MQLRSLKEFVFFLVIFACLGFIDVRGQEQDRGVAAPKKLTSPCPLKINVISYISPTTDRKLIDGANLILTNAKTKETFSAVSKEGVVSFESVSDGVYNVQLTKEGHRKTIDALQIDCSRALQGFVNRTVQMWEGDAIKVVDYSIWLNEQKEKTGDSKDSAKFKIGSAEPGNESVLNGSASVLAKPKYPAAAQALGAKGAVDIQVTIDEDGYVVSAKAISGHPLLRSAAVEAARASRFMPALLEGKPVKVIGIMVYNFR